VDMAVCRELSVPEEFSLAQTCGPVAWARQRSPRHEWMNGALVVLESRNEQTIWRKVTQPEPGVLYITGPHAEEPDIDWARRVLRIDEMMPTFRDAEIDGLATRFAGLRPYADGSLFDGIVTSIVGQSISVLSAAAAQYKLAAAFAEPVAIDGRAFYPLPSAAKLADASVELIRTSGVTWKRAEAIKFAARACIEGHLPSDDEARKNPGNALQALLALPLVGRWTAESALLWGIGSPDAHPTGDIALLRAARQAYGQPDMSLKDLDILAENWRPARAIAARLLWTNLLGVAQR
jgi:3-methyladenine DNA glycosylase/8-oxoguanine DNA glycosylase